MPRYTARVIETIRSIKECVVDASGPDEAHGKVESGEVVREKTIDTLGVSRLVSYGPEIDTEY